jgi:hypothetical protein
MNSESKEELFSLKLNSEGIAHIYRYARVVRIYLIAGILFIVLALINETLVITQLRTNSDDWLLRLYFNLYPVLMIIGVVIFIFQLIYFRRLSVFLQKAVQYSDEVAFNAAFENLTRIAWAVICNALLAILYALLNLAVSLRGVF